jgi:hypothetical protein
MHRAKRIVQKALLELIAKGYLDARKGAPAATNGCVYTLRLPVRIRV